MIHRFDKGAIGCASLRAVHHSSATPDDHSHSACSTQNAKFSRPSKHSFLRFWLGNNFWVFTSKLFNHYTANPPIKQVVYEIPNSQPQWHAQAHLQAGGNYIYVQIQQSFNIVLESGFPNSHLAGNLWFIMASWEALCGLEKWFQSLSEV